MLKKNLLKMELTNTDDIEKKGSLLGDEYIKITKLNLQVHYNKLENTLKTMNKEIMDNRKIIQNTKSEINDTFNREKFKTKSEISDLSNKFEKLKNNFNEFVNNNHNQIEFMKDQVDNFKVDRENFKDELEDLDRRILSEEDLFGYKEYLTDKYGILNTYYN